MKNINHYLIFIIEDQKYALHITDVDRVIHSVAITQLPDAPPIIKGVINLYGGIIPAINTRIRMNVADRDIQLDDKFIIVHFRGRKLALIVDNIKNLLDTDKTDQMDDIAQGIDTIEGTINFNGEIILICDLNNLLSEKELIHLEEI